MAPNHVKFEVDRRYGLTGMALVRMAGNLKYTKRGYGAQVNRRLDAENLNTVRLQAEWFIQASGTYPPNSL